MEAKIALCHSQDVCQQLVSTEVLVLHGWLERLIIGQTALVLPDSAENFVKSRQLSHFPEIHTSQFRLRGRRVLNSNSGKYQISTLSYSQLSTPSNQSVFLLLIYQTFRK